MSRRWLVAALVTIWLVALGGRALAAPTDGAVADADEDCVIEVGTCPIEFGDLEELEADASVAREAGAPSAPAARPDAGASALHLVFFWGEGCPHCEAAKPFVAVLERENPLLRVERVEVRRDAAGRRHFMERMRRLGAGAIGIPTFLVDEGYVVGYLGAATERDVRELLRRAERGEGTRDTAVRSVELPVIGSIDPMTMSLPALSLVIGLVDGINPCAMWVLLVLLSILTHVQSRRRLLLFGGMFVVASGIVYFAFMTAWIGVFSLVGLSRAVTLLLGVVVLGMGLINLKELVWFKQGVSLSIPDKAKPGLFRRMREISRSASLPAAILGIGVLAFLVNLIELGCTLGLPAVFTRILTLRSDLSAAGRYGYLALYNVAYVVPLGLIVLVYAVTLHRLTLSERGAKLLKGVSGVLLVIFGLFFILAPGVLS